MQDLEIYIRDLKPGAVSGWLEGQLDQLQLDDADVSSVVKGSAYYGEARLRITLYPGAFGKRYTSLVIEGDKLPWNSDLECARSAWRFLMDGEIRCSLGNWKEGDLEENKWWRLDYRGEQQVVWN